MDHSAITQGEKKRNQKKLRTLKEHFPDFDDVFCQDILREANYDLKLAIEQLGGDLNKLLIDLNEEESAASNFNLNLFENNATSISYPQLTLGSNSSSLLSSNQDQMESSQLNFNPFSSMNNNNNASAWKGSENNPSSLKLKPSKEVNISTRNIKKPSSSYVSASVSQNPDSENGKFLLENYRDFYQKITSHLSASVNVLVIMRGVSGSGKSHLAKIIASEFDGIIVSADDYFTNSRGIYNFKRGELSDAHGEAQAKCLNAMRDKTTKVVIVDNTNTKEWEMLPYVKFALEFGFTIELLEPNNKWSKNAVMLSNKSIHGVPFKSIKDQLMRFDKNVSVEELIQTGALELKMRGIKPAPLKSLAQDTQQQLHTRLNSFTPTPAVTQHEKHETKREIATTTTTDTTIFDNQESINNFLDDLIRMDSGSGRRSSDDSGSSNSLQVSSNSTTSKKGFDLEEDDNDNEKSYTPEEKFFKSINKLQKSSSSGSDPSASLYLSSENIRHSDEEKENVIVIDDNSSHPTSSLLPPPPLKVLSAYDINIEGIESSKSPVALQRLFPEIDSKLLNDMYKKCKGDLNWCAELLLADGHSMNGEVCNDILLPEEQEAHSVTDNLPSCSTSTLAAENNDDLIPDPESDYLRMSPAEVANFEDSLDVQTILAKTEERRNLQHDLDLYNPIDGDDWQECFLDKEFTKKLIELYSNPLEGVDVNTLPDDGFKIKVPPNLAFELYQLFVLNNLQTQKKARERNLSGTSTASTSEPRSRSRSGPCSSTSLIRKKSNANLKPSILEIDEKLRIELAKMRDATSGCPNMSRIIDVEAKLSALEAQRVSEIRSQLQRTYSTKLLLGKLQGGFPSLSSFVIEELLLMNGLDYDSTLESLLQIHGEKFVPSGLVDKFPEYKKVLDDYLGEELLVTDKVVDKKKNKRNDLENMEIPELRGLANKHYSIREDYRRRCNRAMQSTTPGTCVFYSEMQKLHTSRMVEANNMAASKTVHLFNELNVDPNFVDLHCLYVKEATDALLIFLHERLVFMHRTGLKKLALTVITGRGKNSVNNIAKIQNEVLKILTVQNITHTKLVGHVLIHLKEGVRLWRREELRRAGCNIAKDFTNEYY